MEEFLTKAAGILELDSASPDLRFRSVEDWDSMKGFALMVLVERFSGRPMSPDDFIACATLGELAKFAEVA